VTTDPTEAARRRDEVYALISALRAEPDQSPRAGELRAQLTQLHLPLVTYLARRFANRNIPLEDLTQVGAIGLIKAIDRFDPERGVDFASYATPTILGEIRRHFRDTGWLLHVPRRAQELQSTIARARADLSQELRRSPTVAELAAHTEVSEDLIIEALDVAHGYSAVPIEVLTDPDVGGAGQAVVASTDAGLENVEMRALLRPALESLAERERVVLMLRFVAGKTQTEIADLVGVSQMQVSRLISRSLAQLREQLGADPSELIDAAKSDRSTRTVADAPAG
jgi:RNA polymerase sigma-B factor